MFAEVFSTSAFSSFSLLNPAKNTAQVTSLAKANSTCSIKPYFSLKVGHIGLHDECLFHFPCGSEVFYRTVSTGL